MKSALDGQGTLRFSAEEIDVFRREGWGSVNELLRVAKNRQQDGGKGDDGKPFWIMGREEPTEADTTVFGFVSSLLVNEA